MGGKKRRPRENPRIHARPFSRGRQQARPPPLPQLLGAPLASQHFLAASSCLLDNVATQSIISPRELLQVAMRSRCCLRAPHIGGSLAA